MNTKTLNINEKYNTNDELKIVGGSSKSRLKGFVDIYEKDKNGNLYPLREKQNLIVYAGREWLLRRAFGSKIIGNEEATYRKTLCWFGVGQGGGEPGNPLQAGATIGSDKWLLSQIRLRSDLESGDPGYPMYSSLPIPDFINPTSSLHGYFKTFSSVVIKEDHANPFVLDGITRYPPLIAEVRVELSSDDAGGVDGWVDLNEAGLFIADPNDPDPGLSAATGGHDIGTFDVRQVVKDSDYAIYILNTINLTSDVTQGDFLWADRTDGSGNEISENSPLLIVDVFHGETGKYAYIVVEKPDSINEDFGGGPFEINAHLIKKQIDPYIMFSRVTFSTIRKTVDREIVFLWKIYF